MTTTQMLAVAMLAYLVVMFWIAVRVQDRVHDAEDFFVAGRRLPLSLAWATLFATWFGAGSLLASADEVRNIGLRAVAMEPLGAGLCLIIAGFTVAGPLWRARLLTLADFYRRRFGRRAELLFAASVVTFIGWIAAQLVGMAGVLRVFFDMPLPVGVALTAVIALAYTVLGGMWSVTLTDAAQLVVLLAGLALACWNVVTGLGDGTVGDGLTQLAARVEPGHLTIVPTERLPELWGWINLLVIGALGNLAGADLMQRVFSARSARVAQGACVIAGSLYIVVGLAPAILGLAASVLLPAEQTTAVLPALAKQVLSPGLTVLFVLALASAVLSTLDSAILTAATLVGHNMLRAHVPDRIDTLRLTRYCAVGLTLASVGLALAGESAYSLLEGSYALNLAGPFVPLIFGLFWKRGGERAAVAALTLGYVVTALEWVLPTLSPTVPLPLVALAVSTVTYLAIALRTPATNQK